MTFPLPIAAGASPEVPMNDNFKSIAHSGVYSRNPVTSSGLVWGYHGGRWGGFTVADGTFTLAASTTTYIVVALATGVTSASTTATNWNDTAAYARVFKVVTGASGVTGEPEDHRAGPGGIGGGAGGSGGGGGSSLLAANNLSDLASAATARTNIGLAIGTNVQAYSARLGDVAGITYAQGDVLYFNGSNIVKLAAGTSGQVLTTAGAGANPSWSTPSAPGTGTVTSVAASVPSFLSISGSPITSSGTLAITYSGTALPVANGGTGGTTASAARSALGAATDASTVTVLANSGTVNIDCSLGDYFTLALAGNVPSITFSNLPGAGKGASKWIQITQDATARTVAWPASFKWAGGTAGVVSTGSGVMDELAITTVDNGGTWKATLGKAFA